MWKFTFIFYKNCNKLKFLQAYKIVHTNLKFVNLYKLDFPLTQNPGI